MRSIVTLSFVLVAFTGCATIVTLSEDETRNKIYSGTVRHIELKCAHATCLDAPFSLVLDTVLLPYTVPKTILNVSRPKKNQQSSGNGNQKNDAGSEASTRQEDR